MTPLRTAPSMPAVAWSTSWDHRASAKAGLPGRQPRRQRVGRGLEVFWTFCESHTREVPFQAVTRLLRAATGVADMAGEDARARVREQVPDADAQDVLLLDDLLGIADPDVALPQIDPDARRRRLTALINTTSLARTEPALSHHRGRPLDRCGQRVDAGRLPQRDPADQVDGADHFASRIHRRPERECIVCQTIALAPLDDSDTAIMLGELLGADFSVADLAVVIAERAAGNPFFAEEMVRELAQRGVLTGEHGSYVCGADVADVAVPATVQAAIEARIDRLGTARQADTERGGGHRRALWSRPAYRARHRPDARRAAQCGELIDQVRFTPHAEYAFHHPLIRAVAYESQD